MDRFKDAKKVSILGVIANIFLLIMKGIIGFFSHSQAMIVDAFNSAGDVFSSVMTFIGNKIASRPNDEDHNLGHGKAEYIFSLLISVSMMYISIKLLINSAKSFFNHDVYKFSIYLIIISIVCIIIKLLLFIYTKYYYHKSNNILLKANMIDHRNDIIITSFTLISAFFSKYGIYWFDSLVGFLISIWLFYTGLVIYLESYDVLMDKTIGENGKQKVLDITSKYPQIKKIQHFNSTPIGYKYQISLTIFVDGDMSTYDSHKIADRLEKDICENIDDVYLAIIHVNPL
ncbi:MAG: cation transporter [Bacilli bacterium]|nr:cation transporter [Bacilli bacterium]